MGQLDGVKKPTEEIDELGNVFCTAKNVEDQYGLLKKCQTKGESKMTESKYGKYIITELKKAIDEASWSSAPPPVGKGKSGRILYLDDEVVPGAFYMETEWEFPADRDERPTEAHQHDFDEVLCFFGTNWDDPYDLCGEYELWLGDEKHTITKSCIVFIPKGLKHCPLKSIRVDRPIFAFTVGTGKMYH